MEYVAHRRRRQNRLEELPFIVGNLLAEHSSNLSWRLPQSRQQPLADRMANSYAERRLLVEPPMLDV